MLHLFSNIQGTKTQAGLAGLLLSKNNQQSQSVSGFFKSFFQQLIGKSSASAQLSQQDTPLTLQIDTKHVNINSISDWNQFQKICKEKDGQEGAFCFIGDQKSIKNKNSMMDIVTSSKTIKENDNVLVFDENAIGEKNNSKKDNKKSVNNGPNSDTVIDQVIQASNSEKKKQVISEDVPVMQVVHQTENSNVHVEVNSKTKSSESIKIKSDRAKVEEYNNQNKQSSQVQTHTKNEENVSASHLKLHTNDVLNSKSVESSEQVVSKDKLSKTKASHNKEMVAKIATPKNEPNITVDTKLEEPKAFSKDENKQASVIQNEIKSKQESEAIKGTNTINNKESIQNDALKSVLNKMEIVQGEEKKITSHSKDVVFKNQKTESKESLENTMKIESSSASEGKDQKLNVLSENGKDLAQEEVSNKKMDKSPEKFASHLKQQVKETSERPVESNVSETSVENKNDMQQSAGNQNSGEKVTSIVDGASEIDKQTTVKSVSFTSSTAQTKTSQFSAPELKENVMQQVVPNLTRMLRRGSSRVRIALRPQELGELKVDILSQKGMVTAKFQVESEDVRTVVENALPELKAILEKNGVQVDQLQVQLNKEFPTFSNQSQHSGRSFSDTDEGLSNDDTPRHGKNPNQEKQEERQFGYNSREFVG